jgi:RIO kinase 1
MPRRLEEIDPLEEKLRGATPKEEEDRTVEETLLGHLDPLFEQHLITEVLRPIKTGKEAVVYCCLAHPTLERKLVAAKVYRPFETRSFKQDAVYQQGRDRGSRPDARILKALGKKTRRGRLHKFNAWIAHEERTLRILHDAGADVPEPIERVGPVVLMEYLGDGETPAPMMTNVELDEDEARRIYAQVLANVDLFLKNRRVHADLSAFNLLYWNGRAVIIDFPQSVDPRHNDDAFDLLVRDLTNLNDFFDDHGVDAVDPIEHALAIWRAHIDPLR